jgi:two-component system, OmpR family, KDP operon response regulator KdpE
VARILVIDDDPALLRALRVGLQALGHEVFGAANGEAGIAQLARSQPDAVVLDVGLPDIDGLTVCRQIRTWNDVPIVMLSATDAEARKVSALDDGADDYVTKPFGMDELEARLRAAIRHRRAPARNDPPVLVVGTLEVDRVHHQARVGGEPLELTAKEFAVLSYLAAHRGKTCTHQMILQAVWGPGYGGEAQYLHTYVHRLRQKLAGCPEVSIATAAGIGYVLEVVGEPPADRPSPASRTSSTMEP